MRHPLVRADRRRLRGMHAERRATTRAVTKVKRRAARARGAVRVPRPACRRSASIAALARAALERVRASRCESSAPRKAGASTATSAGATTRPTCSPSLRRAAARLEGDIVLCAPVIAREARAQGKSARARTTRTSWCTARCTCAATITRAAGDAARMEAREIAHPGARSGSAIPYGRRGTSAAMNDPPNPACSSASARCCMREPEDREQLIAAAALGLRAQPARRATRCR